ncbi:hypothetical protein PSGE105469_29390 [Pseudomonas gessardii]
MGVRMIMESAALHILDRGFGGFSRLTEEYFLTFKQGVQAIIFSTKLLCYGVEILTLRCFLSLKFKFHCLGVL